MTSYPNGYGTQLITLQRMRDLHEPKMHPEFARRFFAYIEHKNGLLGVGGGFRATQPVKPGFAEPGKSFHEAQTFASGVSAYCAIDLVAPVAGGKHRSPTWDECADAPSFGLHTFVNNEPWHIQPIEIRGWQTWVNAGRPDPIAPTEPITPDPVPPPTGDPVMFIAKPGPELAAFGNIAWFAVHESGIVRHASGPDVPAGSDVRDIKGTAHWNIYARAANTMSGADLELLPE